MEYDFNNLEKAKKLRKEMTKEEVKMWNRLKGKQFHNLKFRRQVPVGSYIVDFLCVEKKLIIEIDGGQHVENADYDGVRTKYLEDLGYTVVRFWNNEVWNNIDGVFEYLDGLLR